LLAAFLLAWNGVAAWYASPKTLLQAYDGAQYHLLARNRLKGHFEVGDQAHTVRHEGSHPMWRPGLVWLTQGLASLTGSVGLGAALASALGTALMELALLWLARRCFGRATCIATFLCVITPLWISTHLLRLAVGQGPEPWATAGVLAGLAALVEALRRNSWRWAVMAGTAAGLSEWFRTGNLVMFAVPCGVYTLTALGRRRGFRWALPVAALAAFVAVSAVGNRLVLSRVDKVTANLWGNLVETEGPQLTKEVPVFGMVEFHMGGLTLAPGTQETYYDYIVRRSRDIPASQFLDERLGDFFLLYGRRLAEVAVGAAWGLRLHTGEFLLMAFIGQVVVSLVRWRQEDMHVLALAGGALGFYLGPVVLLRGDEPTQYLMVMVPLVALVAAYGLVSLGWAVGGYLARRSPEAREQFDRIWKLLRLPVAAAVGCLALLFYEGAIRTLEEFREETAAEQEDLDALHLEGQTVACRNMTWFVDRDVQTVLFPYARVPELEGYVRKHGIDGILIWDKEKSLFFLATPYGPLEEFERALRKSPLFDRPRVSGSWHWYPVRRWQYAGRKP
jgi:hypothetical protein